MALWLAASCGRRRVTINVCVREFYNGNGLCFSLEWYVNIKHRLPDKSRNIRQNKFLVIWRFPRYGWDRQRTIQLILRVVSRNHRDVVEGFSRLDLDRVPNTPKRDGTVVADFRETGIFDNKTSRGFPRTPATTTAHWSHSVNTRHFYHFPLSLQTYGT